jgi:hypothetical protein
MHNQNLPTLQTVQSINQSQSVTIRPDATYKPLKELVSEFETGTLNSGFVGFTGGTSKLSSELINNRYHIIHKRPYKWKKILASNYPDPYLIDGLERLRV